MFRGVLQAHTGEQANSYPRKGPVRLTDANRGVGLRARGFRPSYPTQASKQERKRKRREERREKGGKRRKKRDERRETRVLLVGGGGCGGVVVGVVILIERGKRKEREGER